MLILNTTKPFYVDKINKVVRMGNFKETGKEIEYENDAFLSLIDNLKEPINEEKLIEKVSKETNVSKSELKDVISYLFEEKLIIENEKYEALCDNKYSRQDLFFSLFTNDFKQNKELFANKKILILGLGGVGANVAFMLSRAGFENFILVDNDIVECSNLIRQYPYSENDVGKNKTEVLASKLKGNIVIKNIMIDNKEKILHEVQECDIVICTLDKPFRVIRRLINDICVNENKPVIFAGFAEHIAMIGPFVIPHETACLKCIDKETTDIPLQNVKVVPSYGPMCAMISSIITNEIVKYFNNYISYNLKGKTMMFNFATYETQIINWSKNNTCEECAKYDS